MLGDAYMSIQEPDKAIEVYEMALKRNPRDSVLARKMGQALVKTHQYGKAINYYKEAVRGGDSSGIADGLRYDMAELHYKLRQYDKAEKAILTALELENSHAGKDAGDKSNEVATLNMEAKLLALLALVCIKIKNVLHLLSPQAQL
jgi:tetratricopeptide repeat protein 21B